MIVVYRYVVLHLTKFSRLRNNRININVDPVLVRGGRWQVKHLNEHDTTPALRLAGLEYLKYCKHPYNRPPVVYTIIGQRRAIGNGNRDRRALII